MTDVIDFIVIKQTTHGQKINGFSIGVVKILLSRNYYIFNYIRFVIHSPHTANSSQLEDIHMRTWTGPSLVQLFPCYLVFAKPSPTAVMTYRLLQWVTEWVHGRGILWEVFNFPIRNICPWAQWRLKSWATELCVQHLSRLTSSEHQRSLLLAFC